MTSLILLPFGMLSFGILELWFGSSFEFECLQWFFDNNGTSNRKHRNQRWIAQLQTDFNTHVKFQTFDSHSRVSCFMRDKHQQSTMNWLGVSGHLLWRRSGGCKQTHEMRTCNKSKRTQINTPTAKTHKTSQTQWNKEQTSGCASHPSDIAFSAVECL